jgi:hypothetical protein
LQKGLGTWGHKKKDYTTNIGKVSSGCGKWGEKKVDGPKEHEGASQN